MDKRKETRWVRGDFDEKKQAPTKEEKQAIADYYEAGQRVGKKRSELLQELRVLLKKSVRQIERYIANGKSSRNHAKYEPSWWPIFAARLRRLLHIPHPAVFFDTMRAKGEHYMSDRNGNIPAPFYWDTGQGGEISVRLYEPESDSFIENDELFGLFLDIKPIVKVLIEKYREHGREYVISAYKLLSSITDDAKAMVAELTKEKVDDDEQISKFMREQPLAGEITLWYLKEGESGFLTLEATFFTTIYRAVIQNIGGYESPPRDEYNSSTDKGNSILSYSHKQLAECPAKDLQSIINIHKALIKKYTSERSQLVRAVLESVKKMYDIRTKLLLEL
ncbi:hypothetical protein ES707_07410 [subsurface metagenome]